MRSDQTLEDARKDASGVREWMHKTIAEMENPAVSLDRKDAHQLALKLDQLARGVVSICDYLLSNNK